MGKKKFEPDWTDFRNVHIPDIVIDGSDPASYSQTVLSEFETRKRLLTHARLVGCERDMMLLFIKADKMMRTCANQQEKRRYGQSFLCGSL
jgi:hypothetical protein